MTVTIIEVNKRDADGYACINGFRGIGKYDDFALRMAMRELPYVTCESTYVHEDDIDRLCAFVADWAGVTQRAADNEDLPPVTGSRKQVEWAHQIRAETLVVMAAWRKTINSALSQHMDDIIAHARQQTAAAWWIDNRAEGKVGSAEFARNVQSALHSEAKRRLKAARA
jgi:hypothetical protein